MKRLLKGSLLAFLAVSGSIAAASTPVDVFARVSHSTMALEVLDEQGKPRAVLTAVVVGGDRAVSTCDSIDGAHALRIAADKGPLPATVVAHDSRRNLCLLSVPGLEQPSLSLRADSEPLQPGVRVFAVSNALGLGVGISEGVISGIRRQPDTEYIQFTASVSPGSEGGALVDGQARLLGIILYRHREGQNVNFAIPAKWIGEIGHVAESDQAYRKLLERAELMEREARWDTLAAHAQRWVTQHPDDAEAWRWLTLAAQKQNDLETEERALQALHRLEPTSIAASAGLIRAMLKRGKGKAALELANGLLDLSQEDALIWTVIGEAEQAAGTLEQAEAAYSKAVTFNPWQIEAHQGLVALAERRGDSKGVTAAWQHLAQLFPDEPSIRFRLVIAYIQEGRPARAYSLLERLTGDDAQSADTWFLKGATLEALGRPLEAIGAYRQSLAGKPSSRAWAQASLGHAYSALQRFPEAIAAYREAVHLDPANDEWRYNLAIALKDGGHPQEALEIDQQLVKDNPKDASVWRQMGFVNATLGHHEESIKALERSLELEPRQGKVWGALMGEFHAVGRLDDARRAYEKLRGIDGEWAEKAYRWTLLPYEEAKR